MQTNDNSVSIFEIIYFHTQIHSFMIKEIIYKRNNEPYKYLKRGSGSFYVTSPSLAELNKDTFTELKNHIMFHVSVQNLLNTI